MACVPTPLSAPPAALAAEHRLLCTQLALSRARDVKPRRALIWHARWFDGRQALAVVHPKTLTRWYRHRWRLFWHWNSRHGRPPMPAERRALSRRGAWDHPTWGEKRFATALVRTLGLRLSPHTVRTYRPTPLHRARHHRLSSQRRLTCGRKHAKAMVAGEFWIGVATPCPLL
jgi:hypothetical protein